MIYIKKTVFAYFAMQRFSAVPGAVNGVLRAELWAVFV